MTYPSYDCDLLISLVEKRPVLWDKTKEGYRNPHVTKAAWRDIFCHLYKDYELMADEHKHKFGISVKSKWAQTRDVFQKVLKRRRAETGKTEPPQGSKESVRFEQMKFLLKVYDIKDDLILAEGDRNWPSSSEVRYVDPDAETVVNLNVRGNLSNKQQQECFKMRPQINQQKQHFTPYSSSKIKTPQPAVNKVCVINVGDSVKGKNHSRSNTLQNLKAKIKMENDQDETSVWVKGASLPNIEPEQMMTVVDEPLHISSSQEVNENNISIPGDRDDAVNNMIYRAFNLAKAKEDDQTPTSSYQSDEMEDSSDNKCITLKKPLEEDWKKGKIQTFFTSLMSNIEGFNDSEFLDFQMGVLQVIKQIKFPKKE